MGNDLIQEIEPDLKNLDESILKYDYSKSNDIYLNIKKKLLDVKDEEDVEKLQIYLLNNFANSKYQIKFKTLLTNLKVNHKIPFLIQLIYENKLIDSIDIQKKDIINSNIIIRKNDNLETLREEIGLKMKKILEINNYIKLVGFQSIMFEMMAEKYYNLAVANYNKFNNKKIQNSNELEDIILEFEECIQNYKISPNYKIKKLNQYQDSLQRAKSHYNILKGIEKINEENFQDALSFFNKVDYDNSAMINEKENGIFICYDRLALIEELNGNYEKSLEYYKKINKYIKIFEINIIINENKIINCIKSKNYIDIFNYFCEIFKYFNDSRNIDILKFKYSEITKMMIQLIIKLAIKSYQNNGLKEYIKTLEDVKIKLEYKDIESMIDSLINELKNFNNIENKITFNFLKDKILKIDNSEIIQRFYLSFFIIKYFNIEQKESLLTLLKPEINLSFLNNESFSIFINYLKEVNDINNLFLISKLFYKVIVSLNMFNNIKSLNCICSKLIEIIKDKELKKNINYEDIIENLILSIQEIMINEQKIESYENLSNILSTIILNYNKVLIFTTRGLLFLSKNKILLNKKILDIIIKFLLDNENFNLLKVLLIQWEYQENLILENNEKNIEIIFKYLIYYQEKNQTQKIGQIFQFLLCYSDKIISSSIFLYNLQNYFNYIDIHPLVYDIIKKIPVENRTVILTQKLHDFEENKSKEFKFEKDNLKSELNYKITIDKNILSKMENELDDQEISDKLIYYLKHQKNLFKYLNLEIISKFYSLHNKELFNLLLENEVKFNDKSLINILQGFYRNNEDEIRETLNVLKKINEYQNKFPEIINCNLKIEKFLLNNKYELIKDIDVTLIQIFNDFSYLNGFANQHIKFILYLLKIGDKDKNIEICIKMLEFLLKKNFDIGPEIFKEILKFIDEKEIINISPKILIKKNISNSIKKLTLFYIYKIIKKYHQDQLLNILVTFKQFIDWIKIPNDFLQYLIYILKNENNDKIFDEIILILGNYFSIRKSMQENYLNEIEYIIKDNKIYKYIITNIKSIKEKNEIFYLFSALNYIKFSFINSIEEDILKVPTNNIINAIKENVKGLDINLLFDNIKYLNNYWKFGSFSPKRDKILRKLFYNYNNKNALNNLKLICF